MPLPVPRLEVPGSADGAVAYIPYPIRHGTASKRNGGASCRCFEYSEKLFEPFPRTQGKPRIYDMIRSRMRQRLTGMRLKISSRRGGGLRDDVLFRLPCQGTRTHATDARLLILTDQPNYWLHETRMVLLGEVSPPGSRMPNPYYFTKARVPRTSPCLTTRTPRCIGHTGGFNGLAAR